MRTKLYIITCMLILITALFGCDAYNENKNQRKDIPEKYSISITEYIRMIHKHKNDAIGPQELPFGFIFDEATNSTEMKFIDLSNKYQCYTDNNNRKVIVSELKIPIINNLDNKITGYSKYMVKTYLIAYDNKFSYLFQELYYDFNFEELMSEELNEDWVSHNKHTINSVAKDIKEEITDALKVKYGNPNHELKPTYFMNTPKEEPELIWFRNGILMRAEFATGEDIYTYNYKQTWSEKQLPVATISYQKIYDAAISLEERDKKQNQEENMKIQRKKDNESELRNQIEEGGL